MKILIYAIAFISFLIDGPEKHTVMAVSGLNLREKPNKTSKVL